MNKLRSDSAFCQLTPGQADTLEGWLFEERLSYPKVVEKLKAEFGLETSLTGVRRFYKRLDVERSAQSLVDAVEMSGLTVEALKCGDLKPAMLLWANKCAFELMRQSPPPIKEVTTLLRAITSAEAHTMRQTIYEREQAELKERERVRKARESGRMTPRDLAEEKEELRQERAARKKAKLEATEKAAKERISPSPVREMKLEKCHLSPAFSPKGGEGEDTRASVVSVASACPEPSDSLALRGTSGERDGERGNHISIDSFNPDGMATKDADAQWQPTVIEEREYAENHQVAEEAENRLTPLNAA